MSLSFAERTRVCHIEQLVREQPLNGKPLGYVFFRERKFDGRRILYLLHMEFHVVLFVVITDKKRQEDDIQDIKRRLDNFKNLVYQLIRG